MVIRWYQSLLDAVWVLYSQDNALEEAQIAWRSSLVGRVCNDGESEAAGRLEMTRLALSATHVD